MVLWTIVMAGPHHPWGHYHKHDRTLEDGDFIILDAGPDYAYYNADISTSFPANGRFTPEQRELYELGLAFDTEAGPLVRSVRVAESGGGNESELVLTFHHAMMDATSATALRRWRRGWASVATGSWS